MISSACIFLGEHWDHQVNCSWCNLASVAPNLWNNLPLVRLIQFRLSNLHWKLLWFGLLGYLSVSIMWMSPHVTPLCLPLDNVLYCFNSWVILSYLILHAWLIIVFHLLVYLLPLVFKCAIQINLYCIDSCTVTWLTEVWKICCHLFGFNCHKGSTISVKTYHWAFTRLYWRCCSTETVYF